MIEVNLSKPLNKLQRIQKIRKLEKTAKVLAELAIRLEQAASTNKKVEELAVKVPKLTEELVYMTRNKFSWGKTIDAHERGIKGQWLLEQLVKEAEGALAG